MENPFNLSDEKLKELLNAYFDWSNKSEVDRDHPKQKKQKTEKWNNTLLNKEYLLRISNNELIDVIIKYSRELEGPANIRIGQSRVLGEIENIKRNLLYIIESTDDPFFIAGKILEGDFQIPVFSKAFWSPLFRAKFPELLPNWNNKTDNFLKKLGVNITTSKKTIEEKYKLFSDSYKYLKSLDERYDFYYLDHLTHFGTVIPEGMKLIDDLQFDFNEWLNLDSTQDLIKNYAEIRNRKDPELWQEEYKWKVLTELNKEFFKEPMTADNVLEKINLLQKFNPTTGTFVHFGSLIDLKEIAQEKPEIVSDSLNRLFTGEKSLYERIENLIKELRKIKKDAKIGTPLFGYLFAMYDYNKYPLYKDSMFQSLKKNIGKEKEWKSYTLGMKYQRFQELCLKMGEYLKNSNLLSDIEVNGIKIPVGITALDGQDFFFYLDSNRIITNNDEIYGLLTKFLEQAKDSNLSTLDYPKKFKNYELKVSFGQGTPAKIPWIAFLGKDQKVSNGIYPAFLFYKDINKLILACTVSEESKPRCKWENITENTKIVDYFEKQYQKVPQRYGDSHIYAIYDVVNLNKSQKTKIEEDINKIFNQYQSSLKNCDKQIIRKEEILEEIFISVDEFDEIVKLLKNSKKKQLILQGPPGTGKTFIAERIARYITQNDDLVETIQFHPSYSYEDFIEGYRPKNNGFELSDGIFKQFCNRATKDPVNNYVLIIDEINRGNLSKIFGELLYLLEYRNQRVRLTYSQKEFYLPENLYIIGTMNTADRSLAIMDYALRRRFYFKNINCQTGRLKDWLIENNCQINTDKLLDAINNMNNAIEMAMHCSDYNIGHSYFMREKLDKESLKEIIDFGVEPLLHEYFFDKNEKIKQVISSLDNLLRDEEQQDNE